MNHYPLELGLDVNVFQLEILGFIQIRDPKLYTNKKSCVKLKGMLSFDQVSEFNEYS